MHQLDRYNKIIFNWLHIFLLISEIISILFILPSLQQPSVKSIIIAYLPLIILVILLFIEMFKGNKKNELKISIAATIYLFVYLLSKKVYAEYSVSNYIILAILLGVHIKIYLLSINNIKVNEFYYNDSSNLDNIFGETKILRRLRYILILIIFSISVDLRNETLIGILLVILFLIFLYESFILYKKFKINKLFLSLVIVEFFLFFLTIIFFLNHNSIYLFFLLINTFKNPMIKRYCNTN